MFILQMKYLSVFREWITSIHRDSYASHIGHYPLLSYMAAANNETIAKTRYNLLTVFIIYIYNIKYIYRK